MASRNGLEAAAASVLKTAVELDTKKRYLESLTCYREGIQLLMDLLKATPSADADRREHYRAKIEEYMTRAEVLKQAVDEKKNTGKFHEQIKISDGDTGYGYERILGGCVDGSVQSVEIQDAYIRHNHQLLNLVRLSEYLVRKAKSLRQITLITTLPEKTSEVRQLQARALNELKESLRLNKVEFVYRFSDTLHDREIRFDTGWIVKIGRGLDYFKKPVSNYSIGALDMNLRPCLETTIDIFFHGV